MYMPDTVPVVCVVCALYGHVCAGHCVLMCAVCAESASHSPGCVCVLGAGMNPRKWLSDNEKLELQTVEPPNVCN